MALRPAPPRRPPHTKRWFRALAVIASGPGHPPRSTVTTRKTRRLACYVFLQGALFYSRNCRVVTVRAPPRESRSKSPWAGPRSPVLCAMCEPILPASAVTQASPNRPLSPCMPARLSFRCCDSCERALRLAESLPALEDAGALRRRPGPRGAPRAAVRRRQEQAAARADERVHDGGSG